MMQLVLCTLSLGLQLRSLVAVHLQPELEPAKPESAQPVQKQQAWSWFPQPQVAPPQFSLFPKPPDPGVQAQAKSTAAPFSFFPKAADKADKKPARTGGFFPWMAPAARHEQPVARKTGEEPPTQAEVHLARAAEPTKKATAREPLADPLDPLAKRPKEPTIEELEDVPLSVRKEIALSGKAPLSYESESLLPVAPALEEDPYAPTKSDNGEDQPRWDLPVPTSAPSQQNPWAPWIPQAGNNPWPAAAGAFPTPYNWSTVIARFEDQWKAGGMPSGMLLPWEESMTEAHPKPRRDLAMVHIPVNFGHTMEVAALMTRPALGTWGFSADRMLSLPDWRIMNSFNVPGKQNQWGWLMSGMGHGGEAWGMMNPELRALSNTTGCDLYYTPQKYWPKDLAQRYFSGKTPFGMLRDPYDRLANIFRNQVQGISSLYHYTTRDQISHREGDSDRNSAKYLEWYKDCDVNSWLQSEMAKYRKGDVFRADCILLPQAEFFDDPHGVVFAIDNRKFPDSFNQMMEAHGYYIRATNNTVHNYMCNQVTAASFNRRSKQLIKEVYERDFELLCEHFGYCNRDELTCLRQIPQMCG